MTAIEKAEIALNRRIERLQANLREAKSDADRQPLFQSLVACLGIGEALTSYIATIGQFARTRQAELKAEHTPLIAEHAELLKSGTESLERLKVRPGDEFIRKEIAQAQKKMEEIQKTLRRGANALQRDTAPGVAMIEKIAESIRRFGEAEQVDGLKRATRMALENVRELYRAQPTLPRKNLVEVETWGVSAAAEIDQAANFHEACARAGNHAMLAIDTMALALTPTPPESTDEALRRAGESVAARTSAITARTATPAGET